MGAEAFMNISKGVTDIANLGLNIYNGINSVKQAKKQTKIAQEALNEQKKMNQFEMDKYNNTLKAQTEGIGTLGNAFASALEKERANSQSTSTTPSLETPSLETQATQPMGSNATQPQATPDQEAQKQPENDLPTERM